MNFRYFKIVIWEDYLILKMQSLFKNNLKVWWFFFRYVDLSICKGGYFLFLEDMFDLVCMYLSWYMFLEVYWVFIFIFYI